MSEQAEVKRRTFGEMSTDARILYQFIVKRFVQEDTAVITYAELNTAIGGRNTQQGARGLLMTARKNAEKDHNLLIETVPTVGIKRSEAVAGVMQQTIKHIGRASRKASRRVVNAMVNREVSPETRIAVGIQLSLLGAIQQFTKPKAQKAIEGSVAQSEAKELPSKETIRMFAKE